MPEAAAERLGGGKVDEADAAAPLSAAQVGHHPPDCHLRKTATESVRKTWWV